MKILKSKIFWGLMLIAAGILFLLQNLGVFQGGDLFWTIIILVVGLLFLGVYFGDRTHWWALLPGVILLSVATLIGLDAFLPGFSEPLGGMIIMGGIGLSFLLVYLANRTNWWAIIPMGVMFTLAIVAVIDNTIGEIASVGIMFLGFGLTFALLALLPNTQVKMKWAWIPAIVLVLIGLLTYTAATDLLVYIGPLALLLGGGFLIWQTLKQKT